ncbi:MAG: flavodoxin [Candidatus Cloacimonadaceae bacterium]|jgi:flavodoxin|nr:hypothetical protein [Candidatus Cloacimonadota bacterium]MDY0127574.1 flavodoxin [Candidatus Cloacimonadaceae bacterium]MCB5255440.1 hypothetical protein [Candidatus Cloacimonadota bacterium]MCK9177895.1 hypothetical protein [Candidatus Cloacimonadota bacterium]MCK9242034.1 hypothetical protein [Candidatus Cloacimonadota bacterium]
MKVLIVYHSESGNTKAFAEGICGKLTALGHAVDSVQLETTAPVKKASVREDQTIDFVNLPDPQGYDALLFGGPVWAFGPSPVIVHAIRKMGKLTGKTCLPFATMGFFLECLGGGSTIRYMQRELATKGGKVLPGAVCKHILRNFDNEIEKNSAKIATLLS